MRALIKTLALALVAALAACSSPESAQSDQARAFGGAPASAQGGPFSIFRAKQLSLDPACIPPSLSSGTTQNDYNAAASCLDALGGSPGETSYVRQTASGSGTVTFTGLLAPSSPNKEGRLLVFQNTSAAASYTFNNADGGSAGIDQILTSTGSPVTIAPNQSIAFRYDLTATNWRMESSTAAGGIAASALTNMLDGFSSATGVFDGAATVCNAAPVANVYTYAEDCFLGTATVNVGVTIKTAGWRTFVNGATTNNGTVSDDGASGTSAVTSTPGTDAVNRASGFYTATIAPLTNVTNAPRGMVLALSAVTGGIGGAGVNANGASGGNGGLCQGGSAGGGGGGQFGGAGNGTNSGSVAIMSAAVGYTDIVTVLRGIAVSSLGANAVTFACGAGASGGDGTAGGGAGGARGGGGAGGGFVFWSSKTVGGTGTFRALGGAGGNGGNPVGAQAGAGGAGSGGAGGYVLVIYSHATGSWTTTATGGLGGTGGNGGGHGNGGNGGNGGSGVVINNGGRGLNLSGDGT